MPGIQSASEPMEGVAVDAGPKQHTFTEKEPLENANTNAENTPTEAADGYGFTPDFDFRSAAMKLKCDEDPDAVSSAIGIVLKELEEYKTKIAFFENLFGYRAEHLMAYQDHLLRHEDIRFYGQKRLQGRTLQKSMLRQNGHEPSLTELKGKFIVQNLPEDHYDFAVVLPMKAKGHVDRELSKFHAQNAQVVGESAGAATEDVATDPQKKVLADKKAPEKDKSHKILSQDQDQDQDHAGQRAIGEIPPTSQNAAADAAVAHKTPTEEDVTPAENKERKRKRAIVASEDEDDERNAKTSKLD
ncbi:hypothetical protein P171DRAFT_503229 [Karstenula rhodostoma CBS 690.94]|uniref:Uncharacterized protein n=1 Tax=Karstenula rhodostoma CBS 690.94 TaxID=1392251 RepID=A0A9P4UIH2_9PLEO|nr:hypothetical protein P171DRAFT_503229 [Karstenula rhodostoma CBS 690.94]